MTPPSNVPQSDRIHLLEKSRDLLGWQLIQESLASYACSPVTSDLCRSLVPYDDVESANDALDTTKEMVDLLAGGDPFPINPFDDFTPIRNEALERQILDS
ncbi:MAG TPA: endonuclease MutS2, partial [Nitrospinaceae bacterium]|nr:endonuclease MutS2 [Nitrospinaceae bacterium]